jgi:hypothetical protein
MAIYSRVLIQGITSPDGNITTAAQSVAIVSGDSEGTVSQAITVKISSGNRFSSSSTSISAIALSK